MIKVLVVEDSFVMRKLLSDILNSEDIEVAGVAKSGKEAIKKIPLVKPDVITLDLMMPGWDGFTTLKHIMEECPTPVIILSAHSREGADITLKCLEAGAVGFILKPSGELSLDIDQIAPKLLETVRQAAKVDVKKLSALFIPRDRLAKYKAVETDSIVVIGASTGGPQTLIAILSLLPPDFLPPIIIVQHMPSIEFTQSLVEHIKRVCKLIAKVVKDNEIIARKNVYLVPGGYSMTVQRTDNERRTTDDEQQIWGVTMRLVKDKPGDLTPSINVTMKSIAEVYRDKVVGVVLTGMGNDGAEGMRVIKHFGGRTLVEDESALIFGMPKEVIDQGCADSILPAGRIAEKIVELVITDNRP